MSESSLEEESMCETLTKVAIRTNICHRQPAIDDVIGKRGTCVATAIPVLPEIFTSHNQSTLHVAAVNSNPLKDTSMLDKYKVASQNYTNSLFPHIALELRYDVHSSAQEWFEVCRRKGFERLPGEQGKQRNGFSRRGGAQSNAHGSGGGGDECNNTSFYAARYPLCRTVVRESAKVAVVSSHGGSITISYDLYAANGGKDDAMERNKGRKRKGPRNTKYDSLVANDLVILLLPLSTLLPSFLEFQMKETDKTLETLWQEIPPLWESLGCYPQIAYVESVDKDRVFLTTVTNHHPPTSKTAPHSLNPFLSPSILDFLPSFKKMGHIIYLKRLNSLNGTFTTMKAIQNICNSQFRETIYDPTATAEQSKSFFNAVSFYLSTNRMLHVRDRMLFGNSLNDWQVKAIASVLYAVQPQWDTHPVLRHDDIRTLTPTTTTTTQGSLSFPASPNLLIIEGPPGTGKTQTIASLVLNLLQQTPGCRILICGPSNCAVDEALLRIKGLQKTLKEENETETDVVHNFRIETVSDAPVLRVGVRESIDSKVLGMRPKVFLDDIVEDIIKYHSGKKGKLRHDARRSVVLRSSVIASTLGSLNQASRHIDSFDVVIIDESSQSTEPETVKGLILASRKCVLVGDSRQLQPTVLCTEASRYGLRRSLLIRLLRNQHRSLVLRTQYRMHPDVAAFPNRYIYEGTLKIDPSVLQRHVCTNIDVKKHKTVAQKLSTMPRFGFVNVEATMQFGGQHSLLNKREVSAMLQHMRQLRKFLNLSWKEFGEQCGIITFYKAQKDLIYDYMERIERKTIEVDTVDSSQGKEKSIILISCVRTFRDGQKKKLSARIEGQRTTPSVPEYTVVEEEDEAGAFLNDNRLFTSEEANNPLSGNHAEEKTEDWTMSSTARQTLGFVSDWHRINVALTRAKDLCLVYGNGELLEYVYKEIQQHTTDSAASKSLQGAVATTIDSSKQEILDALQAADEDPFLLGTLIQHSKLSMREAFFRAYPEHGAIESELGNTNTTMMEGGNDVEKRKALLGKILKLEVQQEYVDSVREATKKTRQPDGLNLESVKAIYVDFDSKENITDYLTLLQ